jgi:DNA-binding transcriptional LysR family regulator
MNTHDLEAFLAVVETGSIVAASARLHITQPGLSRRIQSLEDALGVTLFERQSKPLKPTAAGRDAYDYGRRVLRALDDLKTVVSTDDTLGGELRLGITPYLSELALAAPLDSLRAAFPALTPSVSLGWPEQLLTRVRHSEIDAAAYCVAEGAMPPTDLEATELGLEPVLFVAARDLAVPSPALLRDLSAFPWILNQDGCGFRCLMRRAFEGAHLPFRIGIEAPGSALRLSLAARGMGIALVTPTALASSPDREHLKVIVAEDFQPRVRVWIAHRAPAGRLARPLAQFKSALTQALSDKPAQVVRIARVAA